MEDLSILTTNTDSDPPVDTGTTVFENLDIEISGKEISDAIDNLKRDKSYGLLNEVLSLMLFVLYVNGLENELIKKGTVPTDLQLLNLYFLMYADDMVLFSESIDELQNMLNTLQFYTSDWNLDVNVLVI